MHNINMHNRLGQMIFFKDIIYYCSKHWENRVLIAMISAK